MEPVMTISPSQLARWDRCESAWYFSYKLGYAPAVVKDYFSVGTMVHQLAAIYYECRRNGVPAKETWDHILVAANETLHPESMSGEELISWKRAVRIIMRYINEYAPREDRFRILEVERHFEVPLITPIQKLPYILQGYTDLIIEWDGRLWLMDHKTIGQARFWTEMELMLDPQMSLYTLGLREEGYNVYGTVINQLNTYDYKDFQSIPLNKLYRRERTYRSDAQLESMMFHLGLAVEEIHDRGDSGIYRKSLRKDCKSCVFVEPCLYELKGIDPTGILESTVFVKRDRGTKEPSEGESEEPEGVEQFALDF